MRFKVGLGIACAIFMVVLLAYGCGKDDKSTGPGNAVPSVNVTFGSNQLSCPALGAVYSQSLKMLVLGFDQGYVGGYPMTAVMIGQADSVHVGVPVECSISLYMDSTTIYICGSMAQNDSAVASVSFSKLELRQGGQTSGDITGRAEHMDHQGEALTPLQIQFRNIPVILTN
jgi:hypothetical protein